MPTSFFFLSGARPFGFSRSNTGPTKMGAVDSSRNLSFFFFHFLKREKQQISLIIFVFVCVLCAREREKVCFFFFLLAFELSAVAAPRQYESWWTFLELFVWRRRRLANAYYCHGLCIAKKKKHAHFSSFFFFFPFSFAHFCDNLNV